MLECPCVYSRHVWARSTKTEPTHVSLFTGHFRSLPLLFTNFGHRRPKSGPQSLGAQALLFNAFINKGGYRPLTPAALILSTLLDFSSDRLQATAQPKPKDPLLDPPSQGGAFLDVLDVALGQTTILRTGKGGRGWEALCGLLVSVLEKQGTLRSKGLASPKQKLV